ncbi:MAG: hypothetical protein JNK25_01120 [Phycisphaerae bacterium]|nr:hypothetical protein [Phycisphaerae bacterium]
MDEPTNELTPRQERVIAVLIAEPTVILACEKSGVPERTVRRWLTQPAFKAAYNLARRQTFTHAMSMATRYAPAALNTLAKIASDSAAPHAARVSASTAMLKFSRESIELDSLAERLDALERSVGAAKGGGDHAPPN